jgi:HSP20 family protein
VAHIYWEHREVLDDPHLKQLFEGESSPGAAGECTPPMDVIETATGVELLMDVPGVPRSELRILFSEGTLIVAGRKRPQSCAHHQAAFHLAERGFGRFVRAVRLSGAFDGGQARASLADGELRVVLPRTQERRGRDIRIEITGAG